MLEVSAVRLDRAGSEEETQTKLPFNPFNPPLFEEVVHDQVPNWSGQNLSLNTVPVCPPLPFPSWKPSIVLVDISGAVTVAVIEMSVNGFETVPE